MTILHPGLENSSGSGVRYKRKYKPSPETDALIRTAYLKQRRGDRSALKAVSRQLGWTCDAVCKRGGELRIARVKERPLTRQEDLLERFGHLAPTGIRQQPAKPGFPRSIAVIQVKKSGSWIYLPKADRALETPSCGS